LIEKIMDIAKIGSRSLVPNRVSVEINQEIEDIVDEYRSALLNTTDANNRLSKETIVNKNHPFLIAFRNRLPLNLYPLNKL